MVMRNHGFKLFQAASREPFFCSFIGVESGKDQGDIALLSVQNYRPRGPGHAKGIFIGARFADKPGFALRSYDFMVDKHILG